MSTATEHPLLVVRRLGRVDYTPTWQQMQQFTQARDADTISELWQLEHEPVFTLGQAGKPEHLLAPGDIPVVQSDRGGQVTYHGPGQLVLYLLFSLREVGIGIRSLVTGLEQVVIEFLDTRDIEASARPDAPGVYVEGRKICSLGLRVKRGCTYHGLAFNVDMDLEPFSRINPCGYQGLEVTQLRNLGVQMTPEQVGKELSDRLMARLGYTDAAENSTG